MKFGQMAIGVGGAVVIVLVAWFGAKAIGREVWQAGWAIPATVILHAVQLWLSAAAWRLTIGKPAVTLRIRWIRESVNSLLPVAQLGGNLVGIRLLMQRGVSGALAGAGTTIDLTIEAMTQFLFTLAGIATLGAMNGGAINGGAAQSIPHWGAWLDGGLALMAAGLVGFVLAQRAGLMRLVEAMASRLARVFPSLSVEGVRGLHTELMRLQQDRGALLCATSLHLLAWSLGVAETWIALAAMGIETSAAQALVIESLGMAVRSAGFAVPGALGIQEAGFILVCGLFGIPADQGIALSMLKRMRELVIGVPGLIAWQWGEGRRLRAGSQVIKTNSVD